MYDVCPNVWEWEWLGEEGGKIRYQRYFQIITISTKMLIHTWSLYFMWEISAWTAKFPQGWDDSSSNEFLKTFVESSLNRSSGATSKITCKFTLPESIHLILRTYYLFSWDRSMAKIMLMNAPEMLHRTNKFQVKKVKLIPTSKHFFCTFSSLFFFYIFQLIQVYLTFQSTKFKIA